MGIWGLCPQRGPGACSIVYTTVVAGSTNHDRRLADGNVNCAGSATYQICFRLPIPNLTLNPNPIADPNPNPNRKINIKKTTPE